MPKSGAIIIFSDAHAHHLRQAVTWWSPVCDECNRDEILVYYVASIPRMHLFALRPIIPCVGQIESTDKWGCKAIELEGVGEGCRCPAKFCIVQFLC